jgi:solute carrier family 25 folate transporter 32
MSFENKKESTRNAPIMTTTSPPGQNYAATASLTRLQIVLLHTPEPYLVPVAGGIAGAVSGIVSCPLDVIKTKLQAQGGFKVPRDSSTLSTAAYRGVRGTAQTIWKEEGLRGMYRGLGPMLLGYVPTWAVYLTVYNKAQSYFRTRTGTYT